MFENRVFHVHGLHELGLTKKQVNSALANGGLIRLRRGWYASRGAPADVVLAVRHGVRLTCISAAKHHGLWTPLHHALHVFKVHGRDEQLPRSLVAHPIPTIRKWPDKNPVAPLDLALLHAGRCLPVPQAAILFESAVNRGRLRLSDALTIIHELPNHRSAQLSRINPKAESGTETMVRWFLESRGVQVRAQVLIADVGRVDMVVGESLVIECDSVAYHTDPKQYHNDRRRDLRLIEQGYLPIHLTWEDICLRWESTKARLEAIIGARRHRFMRPILGS